MVEKTCYACKEVKPLSCFGIDRQKRDGLRFSCKTCDSEKAKAWALRNKEKRKEITKRYREKHPEKCKESVKKSQNANQARIKAWVEKNKEKIAEYKKRWLEKNRSWSASQKAKRRGATGRFTEGQIAALLEKQRYKCAACRCSIKEGFHRDHITPIALGGTNAIQNIQLLCPPCNRSKGAKDPLDFMQSKGFLL